LKNSTESRAAGRDSIECAAAARRKGRGRRREEGGREVKVPL
jgi:hypothetical protein|tara:strand:- start:49 stop:174 length:126 start_codon:yes stop_codon:yes gene_type:complete